MNRCGPHLHGERSQTVQEVVGCSGYLLDGLGVGVDVPLRDKDKRQSTAASQENERRSSEPRSKDHLLFQALLLHQLCCNVFVKLKKLKNVKLFPKPTRRQKLKKLHVSA